MANEYHLAILSKGVEFWNQWREVNPDVIPDLIEAHLENANLRNAHLENADLHDAHLENADLRFAHLEIANLIGAHLENADLFRAHLENADLMFSHLENADLIKAHLENANLRDAHLENAYLFKAHLENAVLCEAHLENADLEDAHLENADLFSANLSNADLSQATNFILNNNYVYQTHFSPQARDPWSELRNSYTGIKSTLILFGSLLFFVPYIAKTLYLVAIHKTQYEFLPRVLDDVVKDDAAREQIKEAIANIPQQDYRIGQLLLGFNETSWIAFIAILLAVFNFGRLTLTYFVSPLREAEERSGYSPYYKDFYEYDLYDYDLYGNDSIWIKVKTWFDWYWINMNHCYGWMIPIHKVLKFLFWVSVISFFINAVYWLSSPITVFDFNAVNNG